MYSVPPHLCRTLYDKLGGAAAIEAAVSIFYSRILSDPLLAPFFEGVCMRAMAKKQVLFLSYAFGGLPEVSRLQLPGLQQLSVCTHIDLPPLVTQIHVSCEPRRHARQPCGAVALATCSCCTCSHSWCSSGALPHSQPMSSKPCLATDPQLLAHPQSISSAGLGSLPLLSQ
jgi:hypothetical protein